MEGWVFAPCYCGAMLARRDRFARRTGLRAAFLVLGLLCFGGSPQAQSANSGFNPDVELGKLRSAPANFARLQRMFYLGELTATAGRDDIARQAYAAAVETFERLSGNARASGAPYAAQSSLSLAAMTHVSYRESPLRFENYSADSARRYEFLVSAREGYVRATGIGCARATFEGLFFRAYTLQEWDKGNLEESAERMPGTEPVRMAIRHLILSRHLLDQAAVEHRHILHLADSLGLSGGSGDRDVSEWTNLSREQLTAIPQRRDSLIAREEALQAVFAERQTEAWMVRAEPLLWTKVAELAAQRAGVADPFVDYVLQSKIVNDVFRPFVFGPNGFFDAQNQAREKGQSVRSEEWTAERFSWRRRQEWKDGEIARRLTLEGVQHLLRAPGMVDSTVALLRVAADSLSGEAAAALSRNLPAPPRIQMPPIPDLGGVHPRSLSREDAPERFDEYVRYRVRMDSVARQIETYRTAVRGYSESVAELVGQPLSPVVQRYLLTRRGLRAAQVLLLDTLATMVVDDARSALDRSRLAAGWIPPGTQNAAAQQAIADYAGRVARGLHAVATESRAQSAGYVHEASLLRQTPLKEDLAGTAEALNRFADRMENAAREFSVGIR